MLLNVTKIPLNEFSAYQRLATKGLPVVDLPTDDLEEVYKWLSNNSEPKMVIVSDEPRLAFFSNDVCNAVSCPVVTLNVEIDVVKDTVNFVEFNLYDVLC